MRCVLLISLGSKLVQFLNSDMMPNVHVHLVLKEDRSQMIEKNICLLLGAGASAHLGFPLGSGLKDKIVNELKRMQSGDYLKTFPEDIHEFNEQTLSEEFLEDFRFTFLKGPTNSIDEFLEKHIEFLPLGKYLICKLLAQGESHANGLNDIGWYRNLIYAIHSDDPEEFKKNNLSIVTFNYDRSIDFELYNYLKATHRLSEEETWKLLREGIEIVHVHGLLGKCEEFPYGSRENLLKRSEEIQIISEVGEEEKKQKENHSKDDNDFLYANKHFERASKLLGKSEKVVVFGFGFADDNVNRLNYFKKQDVQDPRTFIIAMGHTTDSAFKAKKSRSMKDWGLFETSHFHFYNIDGVFTKYENPLEQKEI